VPGVLLTPTSASSSEAPAIVVVDPALEERASPDTELCARPRARSLIRVFAQAVGFGCDTTEHELDRRRRRRRSTARMSVSGSNQLWTPPQKMTRSDASIPGRRRNAGAVRTWRFSVVPNGTIAAGAPSTDRLVGQLVERPTAASWPEPEVALALAHKKKSPRLSCSFITSSDTPIAARQCSGAKRGELEGFEMERVVQVDDQHA
jgi:hypothetical protein